MAQLHQDLLHQILDLLDVDEGLARSDNRLGHLLSDLNRGRRIHLLGEKRLADSDLDLVRIPGYHLGIAANHPQVHDLGTLTRQVTGVVKYETPGHIVGVVFHEGLLDVEVQVLQGEPGRLAGIEKLLEMRGDLPGNPGHEFAVLGGKDLGLIFLRLTLNQYQAGEGLADRVGHIGERQVPLSLWSGETNDPPRAGELSFIEGFPPVKTGLRAFGFIHVALQ